MSKGYQPNKGKLDSKNPPQGGSGVPRKPIQFVIITTNSAVSTTTYTTPLAEQDEK